MKKQMFITTLEELEDLQCTYELEFCGTSGRYDGWQWYASVDADVYFKLEE